MNLNDFKSELEGYLGKLSGLMPVGHPWWGFDPKSKPAGVQLFSGQELSREAYPKHWELINSGKRTLVTEEEWQEMVTNQGFCQFYSSGDGSTTYRMPLVRGVHPKFVAALAEAGQYLEAGVPNITGAYSSGYGSDRGREGAFSGTWITAEANGNGGDFPNNGIDKGWHVNFDASLCSSVYRDDIDTVQPEALTLLVGEYVISSVATLSTSESENLLASVTQLEASKLDKTGGGISGNLSVSGDVFVGGTINASISGTSENAVKASQDALGNIIDETYATKSEISGVVRTVNGATADAAGNVSDISASQTTAWEQGYVRLTNGLQICWGIATLGANTKYITITPPVAFKNEYYRITVTGDGTDPYATSSNVLSSSSFTVTMTTINGDYAWKRTAYWIAVGAWK